MAIIGVASVRIKPDLTLFKKELTAGLKAINAEVAVNVRADTTKAKAQVEAFVRRESGKTITKKVDVDRNSLKDVSKALAGLSAGRAASFAVFSPVAFIAVASALQAIVPLLAASVGSLLLIPGALVGIGLIMATIKLGADGIKKAFSALKPEIDNLKAAVSRSFEQSLLPAVNNLKVILPKLTTGFKLVASALGGMVTKLTIMLREGQNTQIVNDILSNTTKIIQNLGSALAPLVQAFLRVAQIGSSMFVDMTAGAAAAAQRISDFVGSAAGTQQIKDWIRGGIDAFKQLGAILVQIIGIIAAVFTGLSAGAGNLGTAFLPALTALNRALSAGPGRAALEALGRAMAALGRVMGELALTILNVILPPLTKLFDFAAKNADWLGPVILGGFAFIKLAPLLATAIDLVSGALVFLAANPVFLVIAAIVGLLAAFGSLQPVIDAFKKIWSDIQPILKAAWDVLGPLLKRAFDDLKPAVMELGRALGDLLVALGPIIVLVLQLAIGALVVLINILVPVIKFVIELATVIVNLLTGAIQGVTAAVKGVIFFFTHFGEIAGKVGKAIGDFFGFLGSIGKTVLDSIGSAFSSVVDWVNNLGKTISGGLSTAFHTVIDFFTGLAGKVGRALASLAGVIWDAFITAMKKAPEAINQGIQWIIALIIVIPIWIGIALGKLAVIVATAFANAWNWAKQVTFEFLAWVPGALLSLVTTVGSFLLGLVTSVFQFFTNLWNGAKDLTVQGLAALVSFVTALPGQVMNGINSLLSTLGSFFTNLWNNVWRITSDGITVFLHFWQELPGKVMNGINSLIGTIGRFFSDVASTVARAVADGFMAVIDFFKGLPRRIIDALGDLANLLYNIGKSIIEGLGRGIKAAAEGVFNFVSGIGDKIASLKGPLPKDRKLLIPAGLAIMEGLLGGLKDGLGPVLSTVSGMAGQLQTAFGGPALDMATTLSASVGSTVAATGSFSPTPVIVNVNTDHEALKDFVNVEIEEGNREVRRAVKQGGSL